MLPIVWLLVYVALVPSVRNWLSGLELTSTQSVALHSSPVSSVLRQHLTVTVHCSVNRFSLAVPCPMYNFSRFFMTLLFRSTCTFSFLTLCFDCSQVHLVQIPVSCDFGEIEAR